MKYVKSTHLFNAYREEGWIDVQGEEGDTIADIFEVILKEMKKNKVRLTPKRFRMFKILIAYITKNELVVQSITPIRKTEEIYYKNGRPNKTLVMLYCTVDKITKRADTKENKLKVKEEVRVFVKDWRKNEKC